MRRKRLFFDIETSFNIGFFWRAGYKQIIIPEQIIHERKIICVSYKWEDEDEVHTLTWDKNQCDKKLLKDFIKIMNKADEIVAHNGDRFDIKWLRTRCLFHNLPMFPQYQTIDTLKQAKSMFNFNSNRLDYIAKFLNVGAKTEHEGVKLWIDIVLYNNQESLQKMIYYCENDVIILEKVFQKFNSYLKPKVNYGALNYDDKACCPECGSKDIRLSKTYATSMGTIRRNMVCGVKTCRKKFTISNKTYQDYMKSLRSIKTK